MVLRGVTAVLWLFAVGWGWNLLCLVTGWPAFPGLVLGLAVAAYVSIGSVQGGRSIAHRVLARPAAERALAPGAMPDSLQT